MKKILIVSFLTAAFGASTSAFAQAAGPAGGAPQSPVVGKRDRKAAQKMNEEILAKLNLTDDQKAKFKAHDEEMRAKMQEVRKGARGAPDDAKEKIKALRKENQEFIKQTLTKDQLKEMKRLRREAIQAKAGTGAPVKP